MGLEVASYISELVATNPTTSDGVSQGDDHIRLLKTALQTQFPNLGAAAVTPTATELNYVDGVTSAIQTQLDTLNSGKLSTSSAIGRWSLIKSSSAASASAVDFINGSGGVVINSTYDAYLIEFISIVHGTGSTHLWLRTTTDATNFAASSGDYRYTGSNMVSSFSDGGTATAIQLTSSTLAASASDALHGQLFVYAPATAQPVKVMWQVTHGGASAVATAIGAGYRNAAADVDGFRLMPSSGSFTSGTINLYGRVKS